MRFCSGAESFARLSVVLGGHYVAIQTDKWRFPWGYAELTMSPAASQRE